MSDPLRGPVAQSVTPSDLIVVTPQSNSSGTRRPPASTATVTPTPAPVNGHQPSVSKTATPEGDSSVFKRPLPVSPAPSATEAAAAAAGVPLKQGVYKFTLPGTTGAMLFGTTMAPKFKEQNNKKAAAYKAGFASIAPEEIEKYRIEAQDSHNPRVSGAPKTGCATVTCMKFFIKPVAPRSRSKYDFPLPLKHCRKVAKEIKERNERLRLSGVTDETQFQQIPRDVEITITMAAKIAADAKRLKKHGPSPPSPLSPNGTDSAAASNDNSLSASLENENGEDDMFREPPTPNTAQAMIALNDLGTPPMSSSTPSSSITPAPAAPLAATRFSQQEQGPDQEPVTSAPEALEMDSRQDEFQFGGMTPRQMTSSYVPASASNTFLDLTLTPRTLDNFLGNMTPLRQQPPTASDDAGDDEGRSLDQIEADILNPSYTPLIDVEPEIAEARDKAFTAINDAEALIKMLDDVQATAPHPSTPPISRKEKRKQRKLPAESEDDTERLLQAQVEASLPELFAVANTILPQSCSATTDTTSALPSSSTAASGSRSKDKHQHKKRKEHQSEEEKKKKYNGRLGFM